MALVFVSILRNFSEFLIYITTQPLNFTHFFVKILQNLGKWLFKAWNKYHFRNFQHKEMQIDTHINDFIDFVTDIKILDLSWNNALTREKVFLVASPKTQMSRIYRFCGVSRTEICLLSAGKFQISALHRNRTIPTFNFCV